MIDMGDLCRCGPRGLRLVPRRRMYVLTLVGLTTMAWTVLFTGGLLLGVLPVPQHAPQHAPGTCPLCSPPPPVPPHQGPGVVIREHPSASNNDHVMQIRKPPSVSLETLNITMDTIDIKREYHYYKHKPKLILRWTKFYGKDWGVPEGGEIFRELGCPHQSCVLTDDRGAVREADAVLVHMRDIQDPGQLPRYRSPGQRWVMHSLESPYHSELNLTKFNGLFNWTSTYSDESDIPCPYGEYIPYDKSLHRNAYSMDLGQGEKVTRTLPPTSATLRQKTRIAAWFVTNCHTQNRREWYISELQKHVQVDVYGVCGKLKCKDNVMCQDMLKQRYKFYIAFENSSCKQYITEKFWANSLQNDVVPVVMGAPAVDYEKYAPPHSFIHIDNFSSPKELARYLRVLHKNIDLYSEYFSWKRRGSARSYVNFKPVSSRYWCDLCTALYDDKKLTPKVYWDLDSWWSVEKQCKL